MSLSNKLLAFCLAFLAASALVSLVKIDNLVAFIVFLTAVIMAVFLRPVPLKSVRYFFIIILLGIAMGIFRFNLSYPAVQSTYHLPPGKIVFQGQVAELPGHKINNQSLVMRDIKVDDVKFKDKIMVTAGLYPEYNLGQALLVRCNLRTPGKIENFNYGEYLANQKIYKVCYYPEMEIIDEPRVSSRYYSPWFASTRLYFVNLIKQNLSPPHSAILSAILLGERSEISSQTREVFSQVGLSHIIAISGMHISILSLIIFNIFLYLGLSRQKSFKFIVVLLVLYLLLIGFKASAVRAVIMGLILAWSEKEGRLSESGRSIVIAASFLLLLNPRLFRWDAGFQLSFAATLGIAYFSHYFARLFNFLHWLPKIPPNFIQATQNICAMTLSAQVATWPLVVYHFGILSLSGIITNLLVISTLAFLLQFGILFLIAAIFIPVPFIYIFTFPVWLILSYILKVGEIFAKIPVSYFEIEGVEFGWVVVSYFFILLLYRVLKHYFVNP